MPVYLYSGRTRKRESGSRDWTLALGPGQQEARKARGTEAELRKGPVGATHQEQTQGAQSRSWGPAGKKHPNPFLPGGTEPGRDPPF